VTRASAIRRGTREAEAALQAWGEIERLIDAGPSCIVAASMEPIPSAGVFGSRIPRGVDALEPYRGGERIRARIARHTLESLPPDLQRIAWDRYVGPSPQVGPVKRSGGQYAQAVTAILSAVQGALVGYALAVQQSSGTAY
jgi:hypothetical protein